MEPVTTGSMHFNVAEVSMKIRLLRGRTTYHHINFTDEVSVFHEPVITRPNLSLRNYAEIFSFHKIMTSSVP